MTLPGTATDGAMRRPVVLVSGLSGGGMSTALKTLEDLGYEAVDNLRLSLLDALVGQAHDRPLAIGIDSRTRDFTAEALAQELADLRERPDLDVQILFMEATDEVIQRRYTETRRPHPQALDRPIADGIARERALLTPLRETADVVIDTSDISIHDARRILAGHFRLDSDPALHVFVTSFAYRHGVPREADLVFDVRFLDNPHWVPELRPKTGFDADVAAHVEKDPDFAGFMRHLRELLAPLLPRYAREGKRYLTIAVGCTGGRHRSVLVTRRLADWLRGLGHKVGEAHRDIDRSERKTAPEAGPPSARETP